MSSIIETNAAHAEILSSIARLEAELTQVKAACTAAGLTISPAKKSRAKKADDGEEKPKAAPNVWIRFTQQVDGALKAAAISVGAATVSKQFASSLKDIKPYAEWTDEDIVAAWSTWEKPEQSKMSSKKSSAASSEAEDGAEPKARKPRAKLTEEEKAARKAERDAKKEPKERKPRAKLTEEEKAERKAARDAKKADSAAASAVASAAASAVASAAEESSTEEPAAKKERKPRAKMTDAQKAAAKEKRDAKKAAAPATAAAPSAPLPASSPSSDGEEAKPEAPKPEAAKPKLVLKKKVAEKPSFTIEQLADFDTFIHRGFDYGRNIRGDVSTQDGAYAGHWDGKTIVEGPKPADWEEFMRRGME
jgi:hypothetical protein